jgi:tetratricopeptide (TPR) repeat protein/O-antigen ligase
VRVSLRQAALAVLYLLVLWPAVAGGAHRGWPLAVTELLALGGLALWFLAMLREGRVEWRRSALDLPLALLVGLVAVQLALGNRPLRAWALGPPGAPAELPGPLLGLGAASPRQTLHSLLLLLTYAATYVLVVQVVRERRQMSRLARVLVATGGLLAFLALVDYLAGRTWLLVWGERVTGRLTGTFVNPDHFGAWLAMLVCLGIGLLAARRGRGPADLGDVLASREARERAIRRALPFVSVAVMALALVFTASRGAVLALLVALAALLVLFGAAGRARWSAVVVGLLLAVTLAYASWIGLEPLLSRAKPGDYTARWRQVVTTLPMLRAFPLLGVGLGGYKDVYFRYQPAALESGRVYYPYAHNDLLQFVAETGLVGAALGLLLLWRLGRDLAAAHVVGLSRCPVGAGAGRWARRTDPFSVGLGLGGLGAALALLAHSWFDFSARIPANGVLMAASLGLATVALHTRFTSDPVFLAGTRSLAVGGWRAPAMAVASLAALVAAVPVAVLALDRGDPRLLAARARADLDEARRIWNEGAPASVSPEAQRTLAGERLGRAIAALRRALAASPTDPFFHEQLAWTHNAAAVVGPGDPAEHVAAAAAHLERALALAPDNPFLHRSMAALAVLHPDRLLDRGVRAARRSLELDPTLAADVAERLAAAGLPAARWLAVAPETASHRLRLGAILEARGRPDAALTLYRGALELAPPHEQPFARWLLATLLLRGGDAAAALAELDRALSADPGNPELHLARGDALARAGDPRALEAYRAAVTLAEAPSRQRPAPDPVFPLEDPGARALLAERVGHDGHPPAARYRRALAAHLVERRLWEPALREWDAVLAAAPGDAGAHFSRALALDALGRADDALEAYRRAVALDGRNVEARLRLARRLWEAEQFFQAINEWRAVTALAPDRVDARVALARALARVGDRVEAFRELQRALAAAPDDREARAELAKLTGASRRP